MGLKGASDSPSRNRRTARGFHTRHDRRSPLSASNHNQYLRARRPASMQLGVVGLGRMGQIVVDRVPDRVELWTLGET